MRVLQKLFLVLIISQFSVSTTFACDTAIVLAEAEYIDLDQAVEKVKKNKSNKVLSAETVDIDGEAVHVIKVLTDDGHVKKLQIHSTPSK
ncbi:MAG: hypothetical protein COB62_03050 [Piscirickettsiaceae bacterium]|nr:MAG: hypothetical protein COB62_03050 [Piscirickettsiaceae bacterium]